MYLFPAPPTSCLLPPFPLRRRSGFSSSPRLPSSHSGVRFYPRAGTLYLSLLSIVYYIRVYSGGGIASQKEDPIWDFIFLSFVLLILLFSFFFLMKGRPLLLFSAVPFFLLDDYFPTPSPCPSSSFRLWPPIFTPCRIRPSARLRACVCVCAHVPSLLAARGLITPLPLPTYLPIHAPPPAVLSPFVRPSV